MGSFDAGGRRTYGDNGAGGVAILARAFELARTGGYARVDDIKSQLKREGYPMVHHHLAPPSVRRQLIALRNAAWKTRLDGGGPG